MSLRTPTIPTLTNPVMIDAGFAEIQTVLFDKLSWLDNAFGRAQRLKKMAAETGQIIFPAVYTGLQDYLSLFPDDQIGNFSFFDVTSSATLFEAHRRNYSFETDFGLIVWFDLRKIYPSDWQLRSIENVKAEVVTIFRTSTFPTAKVRIDSIADTAEAIYNGYTDKEIQTQFLMRPYGGFRVNGQMTYLEQPNCS